MHDTIGLIHNRIRICRIVKIITLLVLGVFIYIYSKRLFSCHILDISNKILLIHTDIDDCLPNPCQNNGTCFDLVNDYNCDCMAGFDGTNCERSKNIHTVFYFGGVSNLLKV